MSREGSQELKPLWCRKTRFKVVKYIQKVNNIMIDFDWNILKNLAYSSVLFVSLAYCILYYTIQVIHGRK